MMIQKRRWLSMSLIMASLPSVAAFGNDGTERWAGFQGGGTSEATEPLPAIWNPESEKIRWTCDVPGYGQSSPVLIIVRPRDPSNRTCQRIGNSAPPRKEIRPKSAVHFEIRRQPLALAILSVVTRQNMPTIRMEWPPRIPRLIASSGIFLDSSLVPQQALPMHHLASDAAQASPSLLRLTGGAGRLLLVLVCSSLELLEPSSLRADEPASAAGTGQLELSPANAKLDDSPSQSMPLVTSSELELSTSRSSRESGKKVAPPTDAKPVTKVESSNIEPGKAAPAKTEPGKAEPDKVKPVPVAKVPVAQVPVAKVPVEAGKDSGAAAGPARLPKSSTPTPLPTRSGALQLEDQPTSSSKSENVLRSSASRGDSQQSKLDRDFSNERQDSDELPTGESLAEPDDVPLDQDEHPFDAPPAASPPADTRRAAPIVQGERHQFSQREQRIESSIQACLNYYLTHPENTTRRGPWALMHAALPVGVESEVLAGGRRVNTLGWLAFNGTCGRQNMFQPTRQGFRPNVGPGVQGHEGQFLAILAQSQVRGDYPLQINRRKYTVMDLARFEMATCRERSELTFKLIGLSFYLDPNQQWRDNRGHVWSLEKMLVEEMAQPINGAACGGVHRLMGLSYAIIQREEAGQPIVGPWQKAEVYINDYINYAMSLQNPDGSFSTNWLESRGMQPDVERKVQTTGHILEWLVFTLPDEHLRSPRILAALEFLLNTVGAEPQRDWPIGPRSHALRAMALYSQRVHGAEPGQMKSYVAGAATGRLTR